MAEYSASQITIANGSKAVVINSGESPENVRQGDFLFVTGSDPVAINRTYINDNGQHVIELTKNWGQGNKNNQPAIVLPSTAEYKTVADALKNANLLVNDNFVAMQDWQTKTGTVTFVNIDGTTTTVKTLKQIESEAQAQLDAYHPHPWAMRKVEFEARRAANNEKFAASGFVHFGKHYTNGYDAIAINEGMYTWQNEPNQLFLGRGSESPTGDSKSGEPIINMAGITTRLYQLGYKNSDRFQAVKVKFPPAEDGTRTYDSATGISVTHATPAIAFASETDTNKVVTERVDMWGFEAFLREINDTDPFVYKYGLIQSLAESLNGVLTTTDTVRPDTYFAWYIGDDSSTGKGVNWQTATEAQRTAIASDPDNNIYFDDATGKFYQWCVRGRSFSGVGNGDWEILRPLGARFLGFDAAKYVECQGHVNEPRSNRAFVGNDTTSSAKADFSDHGIVSNNNLDLSINGECYFLVCGTVNRLNQGAYHPSLNPTGAATPTSPIPTSKVCSTVADILQAGYTSKAQLFDLGNGYALDFIPGRYTDTGSLSSTSSYSVIRPDGRSHDAIYASGQGGVCRDMRYSAWGLTQADFAEADLKVKNGEYRGMELLPFNGFKVNLTKVVIAETTGTMYVDKGSITYTKPSGVQQTISTAPTYTDDLSLLNIILVRVSDGVIFKNTVWKNEFHTQLMEWDGTKYIECTGDVAEYNTEYRGYVFDGAYPKTDYPITNLFYTGANQGTYGFYFSDAITKSFTLEASVSGEYTHTEVIGDPANILQCDALKNGWVGSWNPTIPDGITGWDEFSATRPAIGSTMVRVYSDDNGEEWNLTDFSFSEVTNSPNVDAAPPVGRVDIWSYKTKATLTKNTLKSGVYGGRSGVGDIYCSSRGSSKVDGRYLAYSLVGQILKDEGTSLTSLSITLNQKRLDPSLSIILPGNLHDPINSLVPTNNSHAFKALNYSAVENQQGFINYAYTELKYDGDWGDDGKIHIADNQATRLDDNGNSVVYGTARIVEPLGWIKNDK